MLTLRSDQFETVAYPSREEFLRRIAAHLETLYPIVFPGTCKRFTADAEIVGLRADIGWLLERDVATANDIAAALELIHVFGVEAGQEQIRQVISRTDLSVADRLEQIHRLARLAWNK
jgi:hypothetical protein